MIYHYQVVYDIRLHSIVWYYNMLCCIIYYTLYRYFTMEVWTSFLLSSIHREVTFQPQVLMPSGSSRAALIQFACIAVGTVLPHNDAFIAFVFLKVDFHFVILVIFQGFACSWMKMLLVTLSACLKSTSNSGGSLVEKDL